MAGETELRNDERWGLSLFAESKEGFNQRGNRRLKPKTSIYAASRASIAAPIETASGPSDAATICVASKQGWKARRFAS